MRVLHTEEQLRQGVERMASEIAHAYGDRPLTIVSVLTGSVVLLADLIRMLEMPLRVGVIEASSYGGARTTRGELTVNAELLLDIRDRDVLLVDDIFDTGHTLVKVVEKVQELGAASVRTAVLLRKHGRQEVSAQPDFVGFEIPDEFVVGYGLDYDDHYRNLPYLGVLEQADLDRHHELFAASEKQ
ncbi:hypoxanthine phosphoribosyltransferase [Botrimarina sp.]|uniref:hypoxanthine phosphoribosyltransferase n=1 Tax=Botrimarina sp. TaxID=2795802 RepID=UPI0032EBB625